MNNYSYDNSYDNTNYQNEYSASDYDAGIADSQHNSTSRSTSRTFTPPVADNRSLTRTQIAIAPSVSVSQMDQSDMPETLTNMAYMPAYLRGQIGRWMRLEFLIGNGIEEKVGQLIEVGASYIILKMLEPATTMLCDIYSIKFITIIYDANLERLYTV